LYYGGVDPGTHVLGFVAARQPIHVQRDAHGVLNFSNTD
jgi:hypothetical protein